MNSNLPKLLQNERRSGLGFDGSDCSLSANEVAAALGGGLGSALLQPSSLQQQLNLCLGLDLRSSVLQRHVNPYASVNSDLLSALQGGDAIREALSARHHFLTNPLDVFALSGVQAPPPRLSLADSMRQKFALAQSAQQDAIMQEAFQRGREEALMSLLRPSDILQQAPPTAKQAPVAPAKAESMGPPPSVAKKALTRRVEQDVPASNDTSSALEVLGSAGMERRKKNTPYFDASSLADPDPATLANRRTRGGVTEPFPEKLHRMLLDAEERGEQEVVSWFGHGRAFSVHHVERFCREIMPRYFRQSRLSSFQRQLNLYGFTRITSGPDTGGYYHELFLKGRPALVIHMRRVGVSKNPGAPRPRPLLNPPDAPDFYAMDPVMPVEDADHNTE